MRACWCVRKDFPRNPLGVRGDYRRTFWRTAWPWLRAGKICVHGLGESSFYAPAAAASDPHTIATAV